MLTSSPRLGRSTATREVGRAEEEVASVSWTWTWVEPSKTTREGRRGGGGVVDRGQGRQGRAEEEVAAAAAWPGLAMG